MNSFPELDTDMLVRSADGGNVGTVAARDEAGVTIEKGMLFPHSRHVAYDEIEAVRDGVVYLKRAANEITGMATLLDDDILKGGFNNQVGVLPIADDADEEKSA